MSEKNFFSHRVVNWWNELPDHVVSSETINSFKTNLDKYMMEKIYICVICDALEIYYRCLFIVFKTTGSKCNLVIRKFYVYTYFGHICLTVILILVIQITLPCKIGQKYLRFISLWLYVLRFFSFSSHKLRFYVRLVKNIYELYRCGHTFYGFSHFRHTNYVFM